MPSLIQSLTVGAYSEGKGGGVAGGWAGVYSLPDGRPCRRLDTPGAVLCSSSCAGNVGVKKVIYNNNMKY